MHSVQTHNATYSDGPARGTKDEKTSNSKENGLKRPTARAIKDKSITQLKRGGGDGKVLKKNNQSQNGGHQTGQ